MKKDNEKTDHGDPVVVARYTTEFEAILTKNMFIEADIPCQVVGGMTAGFRAETPGIVKVLVPASFEEAALKLLLEQGEHELEQKDELLDDDSE
ncbi:MAG: hypothetical protein P1U42_12395 [Phycisphaerales bacterium]|nr:hypothetical protein [Phycisphaerales bacterium]